MAVNGSVEAATLPALDFVGEVAQQIRVDGIRCSTKAGSGHPTSSMSAADLIAVLAARHLRYDFNRPKLADNDHLIFSKGHASPLLYGMYKAAGAITDDELMTYRTFGSRLQGHPTPIIPWVDVATGSLGQGIADRRRRRAGGQVPRQAPVPRLGPLRRQRAGRGLGLGGARQGRPLRALEPHRDLRRQPPRPARADRVRVGPRRLPAPGRGVRMPSDRHRRPRPARDRRCVRVGARRRRPADRHHRQDHQGQGLLGRSRTRTAGTARRCRRTWPRRRSRSSAASATCAFTCGRRTAASPPQRASPTSGDAADLRHRRQGRDPQGVRRHAAGPRRAS